MLLTSSWRRARGTGAPSGGSRRRKTARNRVSPESVVSFGQKFSGGPLFSYFGGMRPAGLCNKFYKNGPGTRPVFL